jgi:hypothetical protein
MVVSAISLAEAADQDGLDLDDAPAVKRYLTKKVDELIGSAMSEWEIQRNEALQGGRAVAPSQEIIDRMKPLIRLKVPLQLVAFDLSLQV